MRRDPALTRLSHDHMRGLAVALGLRHATTDTASVTTASLQHNVLRTHTRNDTVDGSNGSAVPIGSPPVSQ